VARGAFSDAYAAVTHALSPPSKRTSSDAPDGQTPAHKRARPDDSELHTAPAQADGTVARAPLPRAAKMPTALSPAPHGASAGTTKVAAAKDGAAQPAQRHKGRSPICRIVTVSRDNGKVLYGCECSDGSTRRRDFGDLKREHDSARLFALLSDFARSDFLVEGGANDALRRTVLAHISSTLQCNPPRFVPQSTRSSIRIRRTTSALAAPASEPGSAHDAAEPALHYEPPHAARAPPPRAAKMPTALSPAPHGASAGTTKVAAAKEGAAQPAQPAQPAQRHKDRPPICRIVTVSRDNGKVLYGCECSDGSTRRRDFGDLKREHDSARLFALLSDFARSDFLVEGGANDALRRTVLAHISSTLQCNPPRFVPQSTRSSIRTTHFSEVYACSSRRSSSR
jgi:hypothetical protein